MQPNQNTLIFAHALMRLQESEIFQDSNFLNEVKAVCNHFKDQDAIDKAIEVLSSFANLLHAHSNEKVSIPKSLQGQKLRLYMDGVFDMVHSGHFNAIRQVNLTFS